MTRHAAVALIAGVLLVTGGARAQSPEDEWGGLPQQTPSQPAVSPQPAREAPPADAPPSLPPPPLTAAPRGQAVLRPRAEVLARARPPQERNDVSMLGGNSLGHLRRGELVLLGFPLLQLRALIGLGERFDVGLGFDTYYFLMNEPRVSARYSFVRDERFGLAVTLEGGYAFFAQRAARETRGARWLTGRRNINIAPAIVGSYQGSGARAARFSLTLQYLLAIDTEPFATDPLAGVPPSVLVGHNGGLRGALELPLSAKTSFAIAFGFDIHGRANDSVVMPMASVGLVTSL